MREFISIVETVEPVTVYHVTHARNVPSIMANGLMPSVGDRTAAAEDERAVYVFPSIEYAEDAIMNWLGDELDEDEPIAILSLTVPRAWLIDQGVAYERTMHHTVPPEMIKIVREE